jgi:hypothetical protein
MATPQKYFKAAICNFEKTFANGERFGGGGLYVS